eukprot:m.155133 g.155133  ORF g.155133 m.155133 type:complete len:235 (-) comp17930_c0_seq3:75-779(-)
MNSKDSIPFTDRITKAADKIAAMTTAQELESATLSVLVATVGGFLFGGLASCKSAAARHMEQNKNTRYANTFMAQRDVNDAVLREFGRTGLRIGSRVGLFAGMLVTISMGVEKLRERKDFGNFAVAGTVSGAVMQLPQGLKGIGRGAVIGGGFSCAYGLVLQAVHAVEAMLPEEHDQVIVAEEAVVDTETIPVDVVGDMLATYDGLHADMQKRRYVSPAERILSPPVQNPLRWH